WFETQRLWALPLFSAAWNPLPIPSVDTSDRRSADWNSTSPPTDSRYPTVILFPYLPTILPCHPHRMRTLLWKPGVVYDPGHYGALFPHRWQHLVAHLI